MNTNSSFLFNFLCKKAFLINLLKKPPDSRKPSELKILIQYTENMAHFQQYNKSETKKLIHYEICKRMHLEEFDAGSPVIYYGEEPNKFYIILKGGVNIYLPKEEKFLLQQITEQINYKKNMESNIMTQAPSIIENFGNIPLEKLQASNEKLFDAETGIFKFNYVNNLKPGLIFGEVALIKRQKRAATILANQETFLGVLTRQDFDEVMKEDEFRKMQKKTNFFLHNLLNDSHNDTAMKVSLYFEKISLKYHQHVYYEGDPSDKVFIIIKGEITFQKKVIINRIENDNATLYDLNFMKILEKESKEMYGWENALNVKETNIYIIAGHEIFGEYEVLNDEKRFYSAIVSSHVAKLYYISKSNFFHILNNFLDISTFFQKRKQCVPHPKAHYENIFEFKNSIFEKKTANLVTCDLFLKNTRKRQQKIFPNLKDNLTNGQSKLKVIEDIKGLKQLNDIISSNLKKVEKIKKDHVLYKDFMQILFPDQTQGPKIFLKNAPKCSSTSQNYIQADTSSIQSKNFFITEKKNLNISNTSQNVENKFLTRLKSRLISRNASCNSICADQNKEEIKKNQFSEPSRRCSITNINIITKTKLFSEKKKTFPVILTQPPTKPLKMALIKFKSKSGNIKYIIQKNNFYLNKIFAV